MENWEQYLDTEIITAYAIQFGQAILFAILILLFGWWAAKILTGFSKRAMHRTKLDETLISFLGNIIYALLLAFVVIAALSQLGVETTSLAAAFAAAGLAIGLALQGSLSNFAAGIMIIAFRPLRKGDVVEIDGLIATVDDVGIFFTILHTADNKKITMPNNRITGNNIINHSTHPTRRIDMSFGIGYGDDLLKAKKVLEEMAANDARILKDPAPVIVVGSLGDSSVNILFRPWVNNVDYWAVYWDMQEKVKLRFDQEGISIPFPQRDVHLYQEKSA